MGWFNHDEASNVHSNVYGNKHEGHLSHELIAGAAGFEALRMYEKRQEAQGQQVNHEFAKELLAGIAAAEADKLCETKGLDYLDREKAKRQAVDQAHHLYDQRYGGNY